MQSHSWYDTYIVYMYGYVFAFGTIPTQPINPSPKYNTRALIFYKNFLKCFNFDFKKI